MAGNLQQAMDQAFRLYRSGDLAGCARACEAILKAAPDIYPARFLKAVALLRQGKPDKAIPAFEAALKLDPNAIDALLHYASALRAMGRSKQALAAYERVLAKAPGHPMALNNRGNTLNELGRYDEALASYDAVLAADARQPQTWNNRGNVLMALSRASEALDSYARALALKPDYADALTHRGEALLALNRPAEALASHDAALSLRPDLASAFNNRGAALMALNQADAALDSYARALALKPDYADALSNRGTALLRLKRHEEAIADFERAIALDATQPNALAGLAGAALHLCDWKRMRRIAPELAAKARAGGRVRVPPFVLLGYGDDKQLQLDAARQFVRPLASVAPMARRPATAREKLRIGYISADFRQHAIGFLTAGLIEKHDRAAFEIIGFSAGPDDGGEVRARLMRAFDRFHDVRGKSDRELADLMRALEIDIAVDLTGHTDLGRAGALAHRPAPVQAQWLGFPGTMGADFIDYVIADPIVLPFAEQEFFSERIVHLPHCYQSNDDTTQIAPETPTRAEAGLPEQGFVFCSFNNNWKIAPPVFDVWMRLLSAIDGSVLWLLDDNAGAAANLRTQAQARGVDPARLVFAPRLPRAQHLARHRLAGLFLDTLPYGAHTTGSDALWCGLPMLTCKGASFAGRVGASLLTNVGLPELITESLADYEALAAALARDASRLAALKSKLADNRTRTPLFDTSRFRVGIERAYRTMWEIACAGEAPKTFAVSG